VRDPASIFLHFDVDGVGPSQRLGCPHAVAATPSTRRRRDFVAAAPPPRCERLTLSFLAGGLPGYFPPIAGRAGFGQVGFNLYDPFNWFDAAYPGKDKVRASV